MSRRVVEAVGVLFWAKTTDRQLFLLRNDKQPAWSLVGGKIERGETLLDTLERESIEEIGSWPEAKLFPIERYQSPDGHFVYHTFAGVLDDEFIPILNHEHIGYAWVSHTTYPKPLHPGLFGTLEHSMIQQKLSIIKAAIS